MKHKKLKYPEIIVCGYPRSGTSLVTELCYMISGYPKPDGIIYRNEGHVGYNEFVETYTLFHYYVQEIFPKDFWHNRKYKEDVMWQEQARAIANFLQRKKCFIFKENYLLRTIGGFEKQFGDCKVIYVDRDISSTYRSICKMWNVDSNEMKFSEFMQEYSESINLFTGSWAWKDCLKLNYDMLINEKVMSIQMIADFIGVPLSPDRYNLCVNFINPTK